MSPGTRIQRRVCIELDCMNSADRAYHVPYWIDAQACSSPIGSMLRRAMKLRPIFKHQNEILSGPSLPPAARNQCAQAKEREAQPKHSVYAEEGSVAVKRREV